jgi:hypothetical protein
MAIIPITSHEVNKEETGNTSFATFVDSINSSITTVITNLPPLPPVGTNPLAPRYGWLSFPAGTYGVAEEIGQVQRIQIAHLIVRLTEKVVYFLLMNATDLSALEKTIMNENGKRSNVESELATNKRSKPTKSSRFIDTIDIEIKDALQTHTRMYKGEKVKSGETPFL